ncbi:MAG TPA: M23 family metallopeptidase [Gammaproteobacteria bacterium]|nr:M23 family metallopeptidase [Gammaproteobacteria bacterium]
MNIIVFRTNLQRPIQIRFNSLRFGLMLFLIVVVPVTSAAYLGFLWGDQHARSEAIPAELYASMDAQWRAVEEARAEAEEQLNALATRVSVLQARAIRLDALGERLVGIAGLDNGEFDFENVPAQGGPEQPAARAIAMPDFLASLELLSRQLEDRQQQFDILESIHMNRTLQEQTYPTGMPVKRGWISSYFGMRTDPFTGRPAHHDGVDVAGKLGSAVVAVASGVVTWSGKRSGYGLLVEVNHGGGYVTRYAHNQESLVRVGDKVSKGQTIARMGSSGRSTGPHVHFEVLRKGRVVDPIKYLRAAR